MKGIGDRNMMTGETAALVNKRGRSKVNIERERDDSLQELS
jgi:hypothetical protein